MPKPVTSAPTGSTSIPRQGGEHSPESRTRRRGLLRRWGTEALAEATGHGGRADPELPGSGGPAGNARLTAWLGMLLLVGVLVQLVTLLDLNSLLSWHVTVGLLLVPPALAKTATTAWRMIGYYTGRAPYRTAGPPPMLLRLLGPLVVASTLALLGSGIALVELGPTASRRTLFSLPGAHIDTLTLHQASFAVFAAATGVHLLARFWPAVKILTGRHRGTTRTPGRPGRAAVLTLTVLAAFTLALTLATTGGDWAHHAKCAPNTTSGCHRVVPS